jgi:hypothetical protein
MVFEKYRSQARREALFEHRASQLQKLGIHQYGAAGDVVKSIGGQFTWNANFSLHGELAKDPWVNLDRRLGIT